MDAQVNIGQTGQPAGAHFELSLDDMGESPRSLAKRAGKVGLKTTLTEFFRAARRRGPREQNPIAPNQADVVEWLLYDRFAFAPSTTIPAQFQFFTAPQGPNKYKTDTNMEQVQRLPDPLWFNTTHLGFYFAPNAAPADVEAFIASEVMEFWVGQKVYLEGPIQAFPGGAGVWGSLAGGSQASLISNGWPGKDNMYDLRLPQGIHLGNDGNGAPVLSDGFIGVTILQGQQFRINMLAPAGGAALAATGATPYPGTGLAVSAYLHGILSRGVQ